MKLYFHHLLDTGTPQLHFLAGGQVDGDKLGIPAQNGNRRFRQRFALRPHGGYDQTAAMRFALEHQNPLITGILTSNDGGEYPGTTHSLLSLSDPNILLWALKVHDDGIQHGLVARVWNQSSKAASVKFTTIPLQSAQRLTHLETPIEPLPLKDAALEVIVGARRMETYELQPRNP